MITILFELLIAVAFSIAAFRVYTEKVIYFYGSPIEFGDFGAIAMAIFFGCAATFIYVLTIRLIAHLFFKR